MIGSAEKSAVWAVVPLKSFSGSKKRLADVLGEDDRKALVTAMAHDVLGALRATPGLDGVLVVTNEADVTEFALEYGTGVMPEGDQPGLSGAVSLAAEALVADRVGTMMVVHGDLPIAKPDEFQTLIDKAVAAPSVTIARCRSNDGTNVMICSPPGVIPFLYGPGSCLAHQHAARGAGVDVVVADVPGLALDIDTAADLALLLDHQEKGNVGPETAQFLSGVDLSIRLG